MILQLDQEYDLLRPLQYLTRLSGNEGMERPLQAPSVWPITGSKCRPTESSGHSSGWESKKHECAGRGPKDHINIRILQFGSKVQDKPKTQTRGIPNTMICRILAFKWSSRHLARTIPPL